MRGGKWLSSECFNYVVRFITLGFTSHLSQFVSETQSGNNFGVVVKPVIFLAVLYH